MFGALFATLAAAVATMPAQPEPIVVQPPSVGTRWARIEIGAIDVRAPVVQGSAPRQLSAGVGHVVQTYLPGMGRTIGFFAHRVTPTLGLPYGPFRYIDQLHRGDKIVVKTRYGRYVYRVARHKIISAFDWRLLRRHTHGERLLLAACHPPGSAAFRYVVIARPAW